MKQALNKFVNFLGPKNYRSTKTSFSNWYFQKYQKKFIVGNRNNSDYMYSARNKSLTQLKNRLFEHFRRAFLSSKMTKCLISFSPHSHPQQLQASSTKVGVQISVRVDKIILTFFPFFSIWEQFLRINISYKS